MKIKKFNHGSLWSLVVLDYAEALRILDDPRADAVYNESMALSDLKSPGAYADAHYQYADYLFDRGQLKKALQVLDGVPPDTIPNQAYLLKGVLLEKMGRNTEATKEYGKFKENQKKEYYPLPVPEKYKILGSMNQPNINFGPDPFKIQEPRK